MTDWMGTNPADGEMVAEVVVVSNSVTKEVLMLVAVIVKMACSFPQLSPSLLIANVIQRALCWLVGLKPSHDSYW